MSKISGEDGFLKRFLFIFNTKKRETILLTAGLRDIDLIFFCFLLNKTVPDMLRLISTPDKIDGFRSTGNQYFLWAATNK